MNTITWLGHSSAVVDFSGQRFLTDPVLTRRIGHLSRVAPVARALVGRIDVVLVSHVHLDHLHGRSLRRLDRSSVVVVPRHAGAIVRRLGFADVREVVPGDALEFGSVTVEVTHAEHGTVKRFLRERSPAVGFLLRGSMTVYFAGDTDLFPAMAELDDVDVALIPIAGWGARLPPGHLNPLRAAEALRRIRPRCAIPIHWGTYRTLSGSHSAEPVEAFLDAVAELAAEVEVRVLRIGETFVTPFGRCPAPAAAIGSARPSSRS